MAPNLREILYDETRIIPNKLTIAQGELVRQARVEASLSQAELARRVYLKQSSVSKIEAGNRAISTEDLLYLCLALDKPIEYFFPPTISHELPQGESSPLEQELVMQARRLSPDDLRKLIAQARAIANFRPTDTEISKDQQQQLIDLVGLVPTERNSGSPTKKPRREVKRPKKKHR